MPSKKTTTPAAQRQDPPNKYAPTKWGSSHDGATDLTVPSGQLCLVRRPGVEGLLKAGVLHKLDSLTALVETSHVQRVKGKRPSSASDEVLDDDLAAVKLISENPEKLEEFIHVLDRIVTYCVVQPEIKMPPNDVTLRKNGEIYADTIDLEDKIFIMQYAVGGSRDLDQFREGSQAAVERMGALAKDEDQAK